MLYYLSQKILDSIAGTPYEDTFGSLRIFRYITFRMAGAAITALILSWCLGPLVIDWLKRMKFGQDYQDKAESASQLQARILSKRGTPTMGGLLIVLVLDLSALLWAQWNTLIQLTMLSVVILAALGFYDDYAKITQAEQQGNHLHR